MSLLSKEDEFIAQVKKFIEKYSTTNYDKHPEALEPDRKQAQSIIDESKKLNLNKTQPEWIYPAVIDIQSYISAIIDTKEYMNNIDRLLKESSQLLEHSEEFQIKQNDIEFNFKRISPNKYDIGKQEIELLKEKFQKIFPLEKKELESKKCGKLFEVTIKQKNKCINDPKFSKENFQETHDQFYLGYKTHFLKHLFQNSDCYGGTIRIFVNVKEQWATLKRDEDLTNICLDKITVVDLLLSLGNFPKKWKNEPLKLIPFEDHIGHANVIIIDPKSKTIKLYDPHGSSGTYYEPIRQFLMKYAKKQEKLKQIKFEVLSGELVCPSIGPQMKSRDSLCANWSLLFLYIHVKCPHADLYQIQEFLAGLQKDRLEIIMQGWACFLWNYIEEHHIKDVVDWLRIKSFKTMYKREYVLIEKLASSAKYEKAYARIRNINELTQFINDTQNEELYDYYYRVIRKKFMNGDYQSAYKHLVKMYKDMENTVF